MERLRELLFTSAIPISMLEKVSRFMDKTPSENDTKRTFEAKKDRLFEAIMEKSYWTHLHKCFTEGKCTAKKQAERKVYFKMKNAKIF